MISGNQIFECGGRTRNQPKSILNSSEYGKERLNYLQWEGDWKPDNAKEMFDYIIEQNMEHLFYGFELGNEVWVRPVFEATLVDCSLLQRKNSGHFDG